MTELIAIARRQRHRVNYNCSAAAAHAQSAGNGGTSGRPRLTGLVGNRRRRRTMPSVSGETDANGKKLRLYAGTDAMLASSEIANLSPRHTTSCQLFSSHKHHKPRTLPIPTYDVYHHSGGLTTLRLHAFQRPLDYWTRTFAASFSEWYWQQLNRNVAKCE